MIEYEFLDKIWVANKWCNSFFVGDLVLCTQVNMIFVMLLRVYIHTGRAWKICPATVGIEPTTFGILAQV
jgi:hypothetical protein